MEVRSGSDPGSQSGDGESVPNRQRGGPTYHVGKPSCAVLPLQYFSWIRLFGKLNTFQIS